MKAPEKIYMPKELLSEEWTRHIEGQDIEYTRTDTFIEKACKWLNDNANNYWCTEFVDCGEMVEDFKNYLKGE